MIDFFKHLLGTDFMPHVMCLRQTSLIDLHLFSDLVIAGAYFLIPFCLFRLVRRRSDLDFSWMLLLFSAFILSCGVTHLMSAWTLWHPVYRLEGLIKAVTALVSLPTAILLIKLVPKIEALPSPSQLRLEVDERRKAELEVRRLNVQLERRVSERTEALAEAHRKLADSEKHRLLALEAAEMGAWYWCVHDEEMFWDDRFRALLGLETSEAPRYSRLLYAVHADDRLRVQAAVKTALETNSDYDVEFRTIWRDGSEHWIRSRGRADEDGARISGIVVETTERRRMQVAAQRLAAIVESSDDAIVSKDLQGTITSWNRGAERVFGYTAREAIGRNISMLASIELGDESPKILKRIRAGERLEHFETIRRRKDGEQINISLTVSPVFDSEGKIIGASKIARDITERRRISRALENSETRFRTLAEAVPDMLFTTDPNGSLRFLSARFQDYTGNRPERFGGSSWLEGAHPEDWSRVQSLWEKSLRTGQSFETEYRIRRHDGVFRWFLVRALPIRDEDGFTTQWLGAAADIEQLKRTAMALRNSNEELNKFAYAAAHDLQEPLRNIVNSAELFQRFYSRTLDIEGRTLIAACIENSLRMHSQVKDLLKYTRLIGSAEPSAATTDLTEILREVLDHLHDVLTDNQAEVRCSDLPVLAADREHMSQLFENLVENSIKYRQPQVAPVIEIQSRRQDDEWLFAFKDNGIGFDPAYAERIFGVFKRLHQRHEYPGTGMGLAICGRIVAHYGGRIWAEAQLGQGATFWFTLPAAEGQLM